MNTSSLCLSIQIMRHDMVRFRMFKINVDQFAILANSPVANVNISSNMSLDFSKENRNVRVSMGFNFLDGEQSLVILKMNCEFNVHEDDWNGFINDDSIIIPKSFIDYLIVQTVGTARGILHCKTEGSPFNYLILPPMNVSNMVEKDVVIPVN